MKKRRSSHSHAQAAVEAAAAAAVMSCTGWATSHESVDLPAGWTAGMDPQSGKPYYYNTATRETSWRPPLTRPARPARAASTTAQGPRDAQRESASLRRKQREAKQHELEDKQRADLERMKRRVGARVDDGDDEAATSNTGSRRDALPTKRVVLKSPRSHQGSAATAIQAQLRGRQARLSSRESSRSSSPVLGRTARAVSSEPTGPRDEEALSRGMHAASDFISCLQAYLLTMAIPTMAILAMGGGSFDTLSRVARYLLDGHTYYGDRPT